MGLDLVTLAEYKKYMGITSTTEDAQNKSLITFCSNLVKTLCRRTFVDYVDDAKTEYFRGNGDFHFSEYPVISVNSVEYSEDYGKTYTAITEFQDYVVDQESQTINFLTAPYNSDVARVNKLRITYNAGFTSDTFPVDLKLAVLDLVKYYSRNDGAVHSHKNPGSNTVLIDYITNNRLPAHISRVLDLYMAHYG